MIRASSRLRVRTSAIPIIPVTPVYMQISQISSTAPPPEDHKGQPSPLPFYDTHQEQSEAYSKRQRQPLFVATRNMGLFPLVDCERSLDQALKSKVFQQNWFAAEYDADLVNAPTTLTITEAEIERQRLAKEEKKRAKRWGKEGKDGKGTLDTDTSTKTNADTNATLNLNSSTSSSTPPPTSKFKQLTALAKVALAVYKSGIKNVWINRKQAKQLLSKYSASNKTDITDAVLEHYFYNQVATHKRIFSTVTGELTLHKRDKEIARERDNNRRKIDVNILPPDGEALTRSEYQLILRTARDFPKLPLFVLVFCICFEFTPLVVLAFPQVLPGTCVIPSQARKLLEVRSKDARSLLKLKGDTQPAHSAYHMSKEQLHAVSKALKLTAAMVPVTWYPKSWLQSRLENHMKQVRADDILIAKSGGAWNMSLAELQQACLDRGIPVIAEDGTAYNADWLRVNIFYWIVNYSRGRYDAGYLFADFEDLHPEEASQVMYLRDEYDWSLVNLKRP